MKEYTIYYHTQNYYEQPVSKGFFDLTILPVNSATQMVLRIEYKHSLDGHSFLGKNLYGFETLHIHTERSFQNFELHFKTEVQKKPTDFNLLNFRLPLEEKKFLADSDFQIQTHSFLKNTHLTLLGRGNIPVELFLWSEENIGAYLYRLNSLLKNYMQYQTGSTNVQTTAKQALYHGLGVCQDFSHVMIGILRLQNIPARYVSGYLFTPNQVAQLHAWIEAYVPFLGWKAFDPANQLMEDENFIKIAHGRDYLDCQPIKGVLSTSGYNQTNYSIIMEQKQTQTQHQQ